MTKEEILIKDYEVTQAFIDKIDGFLFWIRNWAIVSSSAVIVYSLTSEYRYIVFSNFLIVLGFLFVELIQKSFHEDAMKHSKKFEKIIQKSAFGNKPIQDDYQFGIAHSLRAIKLKYLVKILTNGARWHNLAFYVVILIFTLAAFFLKPLFI